MYIFVSTKIVVFISLRFGPGLCLFSVISRSQAIAIKKNTCTLYFNGISKDDNI